MDNQFFLKKYTRFWVIPVLVLLLISCSGSENEQSEQEFLEEHIGWLSGDEREGRLAGSIHEAEAANYIADRFTEFGLIPQGDDGRYIQQFLLTGPVTQAMGVENHISRNVVGMVAGTKHPEQFIIVGAHYDSQGMGGVVSMNENTEPVIHNGADDNASGTAGLLYLAKKFTKNPLEKSILFATFSGEEMGLIGSRYLAGNIEMTRDSILAMVNMDMIGRLEEQKLTIFGAGTANVWDEILASVPSDSLNITTTPSGSGASDHAAFYEIGIPVLHYFTGTHPDYHRESDTADKINYKGMADVLAHVESVIRELSRFSSDEIEFIQTTDPHQGEMRQDGVTLGVMPDYSYSGEGFRVEHVRGNRPGDRAGMKDGDIIVRMEGEAVEDIYAYMDLLGRFNMGDTIRVVVLRDGEEKELEVNFN